MYTTQTKFQSSFFVKEVIIDYKTFNSIQDKSDTSVTEKRYDRLLAQVGATIAFNQNLVILFSYVLLFSVSLKEHEQFDDISRDKVSRTHAALIKLLERYLYAIFSHEVATGLFSAIMNCVEDLRELTMIKKKRQLSANLGGKTAENLIQTQSDTVIINQNKNKNENAVSYTHLTLPTKA